MFPINETSYREWRAAKLDRYPKHANELVVDIGGLTNMGTGAKASIMASCRRANMAIYSSCDSAPDRGAILSFASHFGLSRLDHHLCANADGVAELTVTDEDRRGDYIPYSDRSLSWHTDGYYNEALRRVRAVVLHCKQDAASGGETALLDPEIAYIHLRDTDPAFVTSFEHPDCLTIPANVGDEGEIRPATGGPVFSYDDSNGALHMRYSARKKYIHWRDDAITTAARDCLTDLLADENGPVLHYRLKPGQGLISNNVLHNRTAFRDEQGRRRLLYRARFFERIDSS